MSTILDALRKVEEEKRTHVPDVRTRLLSTSPRFDFRTPRRSRVPWIVGGGLVFAGIAFGAGLMLWRFSDTAPVKEEVALLPPTPQIASSVPQQPAEQQVQKQEQPKLQAQLTSVQSPTDASGQEGIRGQQSQMTPVITNSAVAVPSPQPEPTIPPPAVQSQVIASAAVPSVTDTTTRHNPWTGPLTTGATANASGPQQPAAPQYASETVQRSPFVNSPPSDRIVAPPPLPPQSERRVSPNTPKAVRPHPQTAEKNGQNTATTPVSVNDLSRSAPVPATPHEEVPGSPPGASLSFLQWSADPEKRVASIKVGTGPATIAHEGDSIEGMTIVKIRPDAVELRSGNSHYVLKAR